MIKKLAIVFGCVFGLFIAAAIAVPLFVDVNKYHDTIIEKAGEHLNGKLELGKLGLSLWGRVKVEIDGLKLFDAKGRVVVDVKDASLDLPFLSILTGSPELRVHLVSPQVSVVKDRDGKMNALTLVKETPAAGGQTPPATATKGATAGAGGKTEVPAIVMNARLTFLMDHAKLAYKDAITGDSYDVNDLNFKLEDVSPSSNMPFELTANLDLLVQKKIKVAGALVLDGEVKAHSKAGAFESADAKVSLKLDGLEINDPGLFEKKKGVPLGFEVTAEAGKDSFSAKKFQFRLAQVTIDATASGKTAGGATTVDFKAHSNEVDLAKLGELSPMVTQYGINGMVDLSVHAEGPTDKIGYGADVKFSKIVLNNEALKQPLEVNGSIAVVTNQLRQLAVGIKAAKGFDLNLSGSVQNFSAPKFAFKLASNEMDLDGLLKSSEKAAEARKERADAAMSGNAADSAPKQPPVVDYDAMLDPLHKNPIAALAAGTFDFNLKKVKSTGVSIEAIQGQVALNNLLLELRDFSMKIFNGSIKGKVSFNARAAKPEVATNLVVAGLDTKSMVESSMPIAKNTIKGIVSANLNIGGKGLNQAEIVAGWKGSGGFDFKDAIFSTLDVGQQLKSGILDKLPGALKNGLHVPDSALAKETKYQDVGAKFALNDGVMHVTDINGKAYPSQGLDLKGSGTIKLADYGLDMGLDVIDTYNMLNLDDQARDSHYGHFAVAFKMGCTIFKPCYDWGSTIAKLAQNALKSQAQQQAKSLLKNQLGNAGGGAAGNVLGKLLGGGGGNSGGDQQPQQQKPNPVQGALKGLGGLFGH